MDLFHAIINICCLSFRDLSEIIIGEQTDLVKTLRGTPRFGQSIKGNPDLLNSEGGEGGGGSQIWTLCNLESHILNLLRPGPNHI